MSGPIEVEIELNIFSERLKYMMVKRSISIGGLAAHFGQPEYVVQNWVTGFEVPNIQICKQLSNLFNVDVEWLLNGNQVAPPLGLKPKKFHQAQRALEITEAIQRFIQSYKKVPSEWIRELRDLIEEDGAGLNEKTN